MYYQSCGPCRCVQYDFIAFTLMLSSHKVRKNVCMCLRWTICIKISVDGSYISFISVFSFSTIMTILNLIPMVMCGSVMKCVELLTEMGLGSSTIVVPLWPSWNVLFGGIGTHTHIHTYIHSYVHTFILLYLHTFVHSHIYTYTHSHIHTYTHSHIHTHTHIHTYTHTYAHTHTYTHTYTRTYIHTYILLKGTRWHNMYSMHC